MEGITFKNKIVTAEQAVAIIRNGDVIATSGFNKSNYIN